MRVLASSILFAVAAAEFKFGDMKIPDLKIPDIKLDGAPKDTWSLGLADKSFGTLKVGPYSGTNVYSATASAGETKKLVVTPFFDIEMTCAESSSGPTEYVETQINYLRKFPEDVGVSTYLSNTSGYNDSPTSCDDLDEFFAQIDGQTYDSDDILEDDTTNPCMLSYESSSNDFSSDYFDEYTHVVYSNGLAFHLSYYAGLHNAIKNPGNSANYQKFFGTDTQCVTSLSIALSVPDKMEFSLPGLAKDGNF